MKMEGTMADSPQLQAVCQMMKSFGERAQALGSVEGFRMAYEEMTAQFKVGDDIECERLGVGGMAAEWVSAPGADKDRVQLYLHGGGYVIGSMRTHRSLMSDISRASGARVLGIEYRLAPEHPFPAAVEDSVTAYRWLLSQGIEPGHITLNGDSAGGGLVVAALVALRYLGEPMPAAGICMSPWVDMEGIGESMTTKAEVDPAVQKEGLQFMGQMYLGKSDPRAPLAAPLYADLHGLPPLLILVGSAETLLDDSTRLAERAKAAGVKVDLEVWEDMIHVWPAFAPILPEGQQAIDRMADFMRQHTG
jgi:acetyl esterase/lipase